MASIGRGVAYYQCLVPNCRHKWKVRNSTGSTKDCPECGDTDIKPYRFVPKPPEYRRMFGDFNCNCGNSWKSAYTWVLKSGNGPRTKWQKCLRCKNEVYPTNYRPLIYTGSVSQGGHDSSECQRCIELGGDCRNYVASNRGDNDEIPDDLLNVISEASSVSSSVSGDELDCEIPSKEKQIECPADVEPDDIIPHEILKKGAKAVDLYFKALKKGKKRIPRCNFPILGQAGVGKTSLYRHLVNLKFNPKQESTCGIDNTIVGTMVDTREFGAKDWAEKDETEVKQHADQQFADGVVGALPSDLLTLSDALQAPEKSSKDSSQVKTQQSVTSPFTEEGPSASNQSMAVARGAPKVSSQQAKLIDQAFMAAASKERKEPVLELILNVLDFAGQEEYHPMHHCFLTRHAIYLVVFNINHVILYLEYILSQQSVPTARNKSVANPFEELRYWLHSIHAHSLPAVSDKEEEKSLVLKNVCLVGTHRGTLNESKQRQLKQINDLIKKELHGDKRCLNHLHRMGRKGDEIFKAVENSMEDREASGANALRKEINVMAENLPFLREEYPVIWLRFDTELTRLKEKISSSLVVPIDEVLKIATQVGITDPAGQDLALEFYHETGKIVCLKFLPPLFISEEEHDELKELVLLDPKWLIHVMKNVMELNFRAQIEGAQIDKLKETGIATSDLLKEAWSKYLRESKKQLLNFRQMCLILQAEALIHPIRSIPKSAPEQSPSRSDPTLEAQPSSAPPTSEAATRNENVEYLIPGKLPAANIVKKPDRGITFYFDFQRFLPREIYHRLVCLLLAVTQKKKSFDKRVLSQNMCQFQNIDGCNWRIQLDAIHHRLMITVFPSETDSRSPTHHITTMHTEYLQKICQLSDLQGLRYVGGPLLDPCSQCGQTGVIRYVSYYEGDKLESTESECPTEDCRKDYDVDQLLTNQDKLADTSNAVVATSNIQSLLEKDWADICCYLIKLDEPQIQLLGGVLGLNVYKLEKMKNLPNDMVRAWLRREDDVISKSGPQLTWSVLVEALHKINQKGVANEIHKDKCTQNSCCKAYNVHKLLTNQDKLADTSNAVVATSNIQSLLVPVRRSFQKLSNFKVVSQYYRCAENTTHIPFIDPVTVVTCDHHGLKHTLTDHDITLAIPEGAIPKGMVIHIELAVALYGPFSFPKNTRPISPILWFCPQKDIEFSLPIQVTMPHCLTNATHQKLDVGFAKADHNDYIHSSSEEASEVMFNFKRCTTQPQFSKKGKQGFGCLETVHCCFLCLTAKQCPQIARKEGYCLSRIDLVSKSSTYVITYCVSYFLPSCLKVLRMQFPEYVDKHHFHFTIEPEVDHKAICLHIGFPSQDKYTVNVKPSNREINMAKVDFWTSNEDTMKLKHDCELYPPRVITNWVLLDVETPNEYSTFQITVTGHGCTIIDGHLNNDVTLPLVSHNPLISSSTLTTNENPNSPVSQSMIATHRVTEVLVEKDWAKICCYLIKLDEPQIQLLGGVLGLSVYKLEKMKNLPNDMVRAWLRQEDDVKKECGPQLTWNTLVEALRKIKQTGVADEIHKDKCT